MTRVCILDYGSGNVKSVFNLLAAVSPHVQISNDVSEIESATHLILPGVGAFAASMGRIRAHVPLEAVKRQVFERGKPFLGICVGMQVLADTGFEFGECPGLGWVGGVVDKLESQPHPLPHIGWNNIEITRPSPLLSSFGSNQDFYFLHSYVFRPLAASDVLAEVTYGQTFAAVIGRDNVFGVQFHPEKSQKAGRILMENFLRLS